LKLTGLTVNGVTPLTVKLISPNDITQLAHQSYFLPTAARHYFT